MKVIQIVPGVDGVSSGPAYTVPALCRGLKESDVDVELLAPGRIPPHDYGVTIRGFERNDIPHLVIGRATGMYKYLKSVVADVDVMHTNGLWLMSNVYPYWATKGTSCKFVIQPRGTLSEWALNNSKWKKRLFGMIMQYRAMRDCDMWVATAMEELEDIRRLGYKQPVCVLPNGIDIPKIRYNKTVERKVIFLSRIHPKKGVDMLLEAWHILQNDFPEWSLEIAGPIDSYAKEMMTFCEKLGCERCRFVGEVVGDEKQKFYGESDFLVLPTHSENFGMVVAEALSNATAVICSKGAPWAGLNKYGCGEWIDIGLNPLMSTMREYMSKSREELVEMGKRGLEWMKRDYGWNEIGRKMSMAYEWLCNRGEKPECVYL